MFLVNLEIYYLVELFINSIFYKKLGLLKYSKVYTLYLLYNPLTISRSKSIILDIQSGISNKNWI